MPTLASFGASIDGVTDVTSKLQDAMNSGKIVDGEGYTYCVSGGVATSLPTVLKNMTLKVKVGPGGFNSYETADNRYSTAQCLLRWNGADGGGLGGFVRIVSAPVSGSERVVLPVAVSGGCATRAWTCDRLEIVGFNLLTGGLAINSIGAAGADIDYVAFLECKLNAPAGVGGVWKRFGADLLSAQMTGLSIDSDLEPSLALSGRISIGEVRGDFSMSPAAFAVQGREIDLVTLQGKDATAPMYIGKLDGRGCGEVIDHQRSNVLIDEVIGDDCISVCKFVHGAKNSRVGRVHSTSKTYHAIVQIGGSSYAGDTAKITIDSVSGQGVGAPFHAGVLSSATTGTAVLETSALQVNNYYSQGNRGSYLRITSGSLSGVERQITSYNGAARTISFAALPSAPANGTTYEIHLSDNRSAVSFEGGSARSPMEAGDVVGQPRGCRVNNIAVSDDTQRMNHIVRFNMTDAALNNEATIARDLGCQAAPVYNPAGVNGPVRVRPEASCRAATVLTLSAAQSTINGELYLPMVCAEDSYIRPGAANPQFWSTGPTGLRVRLSGEKTITFNYRQLASGSNQEVMLIIRRNSAAVAVKQATIGANDAGVSLTTQLYHQESWLNNPEDSVYTASVYTTVAGRQIGPADRAYVSFAVNG